MICHAASIYIELLIAPCVLRILGRRLVALLQGARPRPIDLASLRKARCCNDGEAECKDERRTGSSLTFVMPEHDVTPSWFDA
jgi:hypothetical protein